MSLRVQLHFQVMQSRGHENFLTTGIDRLRHRLSRAAHACTGENLTMKSFLVTAAILAAFVAGSALAAEPATATPPTMKDGMFVTAKGMTLYTFDKDTAGKSVCNGPCATNWPPALVADGGKASGDWTIVTRDDGQKQWAFKGKPLYAFAKDTKAGDKTGDGFLNGAWHVAK
jgi:predicted lipoprotein with Yx(FWY)xxD motif